jgi:hypothetical protein
VVARAAGSTVRAVRGYSSTASTQQLGPRMSCIAARRLTLDTFALRWETCAPPPPCPSDAMSHILQAAGRPMGARGSGLRNAGAAPPFSNSILEYASPLSMALLLKLPANYALCHASSVCTRIWRMSPSEIAGIAPREAPLRGGVTGRLRERTCVQSRRSWSSVVAVSSPCPASRLQAHIDRSTLEPWKIIRHMTGKRRATLAVTPHRRMPLYSDVCIHAHRALLRSHALFVL